MKLESEDSDAMVGNPERKSFPCTKCDHEFPKLHLLNTHIKIHHSTSAYACPNCPKIFKMKHHLVDHLKTHQPARAMQQCPLCEKAFTNTGNLNVHIRAKHEKVTFPCAECGREFAYKHKMQEHVRREHGENEGKNKTKRSDTEKAGTKQDKRAAPAKKKQKRDNASKDESVASTTATVAAMEEIASPEVVTCNS